MTAIRNSCLLLLSAVLLANCAVAAELRGAWIPSVFNLCFPSHAGLSTKEQQDEIVRLLDEAQALHLNAVFFQVRPESDTLYSSTIEPWSRFLSGQQGNSPGYDPLAYMIREAKKRGIGVHAWFNPFRAAATAAKPLYPTHIASLFPSFAYEINGSLWMDPGSQVVRRHILRVVMDVVKRYDIAGVHLDDYFYPYPVRPPKPVLFPDSETYRLYRSTGGQLTLGDWRRENVNDLVEQLSASIKAVKPHVLFGISPFGIYRPGVPASIHANLDQYAMLYSDPVLWLKEGWVDYLAPQLYWPDGSDQSYSALLSWWRSPQINPLGIPIYPGIALERLSPPFDWPASEIVHQVRLAEEIQHPSQTATGFILWQLQSIVQNTKGIRTALENQPNN